MNTPKLKALAPDLRQAPPRSPHEKLGGYVCANYMVYRRNFR
jgi:hypothetical protein